MRGKPPKDKKVAHACDDAKPQEVLEKRGTDVLVGANGTVERRGRADVWTCVRWLDWLL